jgi:hypothetical protein
MMTGQKKDEPGQKQAKSDARQARLGAELRANLLKRKAQAKAKEPSRDRDEGGQS